MGLGVTDFTFTAMTEREPETGGSSSSLASPRRTTTAQNQARSPLGGPQAVEAQAARAGSNLNFNSLTTDMAEQTTPAVEPTQERANAKPVIRLENVYKTYDLGEIQVQALARGFA